MATNQQRALASVQPQTTASAAEGAAGLRPRRSALKPTPPGQLAFAFADARRPLPDSRIALDEAGDPKPAPRRLRKPIAAGVASPTELGALIRMVRLKLAMNQGDFAAKAGVGRRFLSECENGKPTLELGKVLAVCRAAGIELLARRWPLTSPRTADEPAAWAAPQL